MAEIDSEWELLLKKSQPRGFSDSTVFDILSRLPVKSIIRFKSVSKKWHDLFAESHFIKAHLQQSTEGSDHCYLAREFNHVNAGTSTVNRAIFSLRSEENFQKLCDLHFKREPSFKYFIVTSVDGLVCIERFDHRLKRSDLDILIWNPATRELRIVPKFLGQDRSLRTCVGFGFDPKYNDYKVVAVSCSEYTIELNVFSLRTNCWRFVGVVPNKDLLPYPVHVNGMMHCLGCDSSHNMIFSFDFIDEKYIEMDVPEIGISVLDPGNFSMLCKSPASLGESLILCEFTIDSAEWQWQWQIWFMKEYGNSNSWTRLQYFPSHPIYGCYIHPCIFLDNGKIIMQQSEDQMVLYDPKNQVKMSIDFDNGGQAVKHKESLVSVRGSGSISNLNCCALVSENYVG